MNVFIWSDNHFFHDNIIKYCSRPFEFSKNGSLECLKYQINNYLKTVKEDDLCIFLGDLVYLNKCNVEKFEEMFNKLPGHKILVLGNHDDTDYDFKRLGFEFVLDYFIIDKTMFCHYPLTEDSEFLKAFKDNNCNLLYHGHVHNKEVQNIDFKRINCCVDYGDNNYTPIEISDSTLKSQILEKFGYL